MLKCKECKFARRVPGSSHHMECTRASSIVTNPNKRAIEKGWFSFPFDFDPIWGEECTGFVSSSINLEKLSLLDLKVMVRDFSGIMKFHSNKKWEYINPLKRGETVKKTLEFIEKYREMSSKEEITREDYEELVKFSWTI